MNDFIEDERFQRELERAYVQREKKLNERSEPGAFIIEVVDEKTGVEEPLGIVIPGEDLEIESDEI